MANKTISVAVGKGKGLVTAPNPRKLSNTPTPPNTAGTKRAPGYN